MSIVLNLSDYDEISYNSNRKYNILVNRNIIVIYTSNDYCIFQENSDNEYELKFNIDFVTPTYFTVYNDKIYQVSDNGIFILDDDFNWILDNEEFYNSAEYFLSVIEKNMNIHSVNYSIALTKVTDTGKLSVIKIGKDIYSSHSLGLSPFDSTNNYFLDKRGSIFIIDETNSCKLYKFEDRDSYYLRDTISYKYVFPRTYVTSDNNLILILHDMINMKLLVYSNNLSIKSKFELVTELSTNYKDINDISNSSIYVYNNYIYYMCSGKIIKYELDI